MKKLLYHFIWLLLMCLASPSYANVGLHFAKKQHNFGSIQEDGGTVRTVFPFKNAYHSPIKITDITVSCGCTSPAWPKQAIAPGDTGSIRITYNPLSRPGAFEKQIKVKLEDGAEIQLSILGEVIPRALGIQDWFPFQLGSLRFKEVSMTPGSIFHDATLSLQNGIYNTSKEAIVINWDKSIFPAFIHLNKRGTEVIQPNDSLAFEIQYDASKVHDWGYVSDTFHLATNDLELPQKTLAVLSHIKERFNEEEPHAQLEVTNNKHDFGQLAYNSTQQAKFQIKNSGTNTLHIRKIINICDCLVIDLAKNELAPNETTTIHVTFHTKEYVGHLIKAFSIISNTPSKTEHYFMIKANVLEQE